MLYVVFITAIHSISPQINKSTKYNLVSVKIKKIIVYVPIAFRNDGIIKHVVRILSSVDDLIKK